MRKLFVALAGNIGAGKTTAAKLISQRLGFELFDEPVIDNRFLRDYYGDMKRWSFTLQLEFLMKRAQHHELIHTVPKSCIQDRTLLEDPTTSLSPVAAEPFKCLVPSWTGNERRARGARRQSNRSFQKDATE